MGEKNSDLCKKLNLIPQSNFLNFALMKLDLLNEHAKRAYFLLAGLVSPRPIALVTTLNPEGKVNAAPFSFFAPIGTAPAMLVFAPADKPDGTPKDTYKNLRSVGECVVHIIDEPMAEAMNLCATELPEELSEVDMFNLQTAPSDTVKVPRLANAPVAMECEFFSTFECGKANRAVFVSVKAIHVRDGIVDPEKIRVNPEAWNPIAIKAAPECYCRTDSMFKMHRPKYDPKA